VCAPLSRAVATVVSECIWRVCEHGCTKNGHRAAAPRARGDLATPVLYIKHSQRPCICKLPHPLRTHSARACRGPVGPRGPWPRPAARHPLLLRSLQRLLQQLVPRVVLANRANLRRAAPRRVRQHGCRACTCCRQLDGQSPSAPRRALPGWLVGGRAHTSWYDCGFCPCWRMNSSSKRRSLIFSARFSALSTCPAAPALQTPARSAAAAAAVLCAVSPTASQTDRAHLPDRIGRVRSAARTGSSWCGALT